MQEELLEYLNQMKKGGESERDLLIYMLNVIK